MRALALFALVLAVLPRHACERHNPDRCTDDSECAESEICQGPDGQKECSPAQCGRNDQCNADTPVCSGKRCGRCSDNAQCAGRPSAPFCEKTSGACIECTKDAECADPNRAICDTETHSCRGCVRHAECPGVCAKDDLLSTLPRPIARGACVPLDRVILVDGSLADCDTPNRPLCTVRAALASLSPDRPYVRVISNTARVAPLTLPANGALKIVHLIGPTADTPVTKLTAQPLVVGAAATPAAIKIGDGTKAVLEGLVLQDSTAGIDCAGLSNARSEVRLLRSVVAQTEAAVRAANCDVTIDASWIGKPSMAQLRGLRNNLRAMDLRDSDLDMVNSVLWFNGILGSFGGISLTDTPGRTTRVSRIVNSTLADQDNSIPGGPATLDCSIDLGKRLALVNSYFINGGVGGPGQPGAHVSPTCKAQVVNVASNDPALSQGNLLVKLPGDFANYAEGDFHLNNDAGARAAGRGEVMLGGETSSAVPTVDIEGTRRGKLLPGQVSVGAFEVHSGP